MTIKSLWVLGVVAAVLWSGLASGATVSTSWGGAAELATWQEIGVTYARASDLFTLLEGTVDPGRYPVDVQVVLQGHSLSLFYDSPFVRFDDEVFNLVFPVRLRGGDAAVPLATTAELAALLLGVSYRWEPEGQVLSFFRSGGAIASISAEQKRNGLILDIYTGGPVDYEVYLSMDDWLNIIIPGGRVGSLSFDRRPYQRYIWEFKTYQFKESAQISFRLQPGRVRFEHRLLANPDRIQLTLIDTTFALDSSASPGLFVPDTAPAPGLETDPIDVIVVDAGHGGEDFGAVGPRGTREKDVVLAIALELAGMLEADPDFHVILTRSDDRFIPLQRRAEIANEANADLFISIHANSAPRKTARGFETFFLAAAKSDEARATAQLENASLRFEESGDERPAGTDIDFILTDLLQNQFLVESAALAQTIQRELGRSVKTPDRGVNQAGFVVLYHAYMPSVLIETGFISNRDEEAWLASSHAQKQIAEAVYRSILAFRKQYEEQP
jgi:N-acetylmuramoyl-L-alanine amidase